MTTEREFYSNGQLKWEENHENGELHGLSRVWYKDGQLWFESNWENGKPHGPSREWYESGQLEGELNYDNGKLHGIQRFWDDNGQLTLEEKWERGKKTNNLMTEETKPMNHAETAQEKRTKFLELLRELDAPASVKTELLNAFFNSDSAAWKDGFEAANAINDKIKC